jgi:hypothetical protein
MLWFFERGRESIRLETRYDNESSEFVGFIRHPDGREETLRFPEAEKFHAWLVTLEQTLKMEHWVNHGGPVILPYGWPNKRLT